MATKIKDKIQDRPPDEVTADVRGLRLALDDEIPERIVDHNVLVATWNLRHFGGLTKKWHATGSDSPKRDLHSLLLIAEILSRFDVIALQEVRGDLRAFRHLLKALNHPEPHWGFVLTDVTRGKKGNDERMAFVFDTRRVRPSGLAAELVLPEDMVEAVGGQFARTPYAVSFWAGGKTFILVTLHILYGEDKSDRLPEIRAIARWLADWAEDINAFDHNLIALGDFNIDRHGDPLYEALVSRGLSTPPQLEHLPRTIFGSGGSHHHYDQIAWFTEQGNTPALSLHYTRRGGNFDFVPYVMRDRHLELRELSWKISDHYPLWVEFRTDEERG